MEADEELIKYGWEEDVWWVVSTHSKSLFRKLTSPGYVTHCILESSIVDRRSST